MTDKELRKLSRMELIQLLLEQTRELERVQQELAETREALNDRQIKIHTAGSIAQASLQINSVMEAAQRAADQYAESVKLEYGERARKQYEQVVARLRQMEEDTIAECDAMLQEAGRKADCYDADESL